LTKGKGGAKAKAESGQSKPTNQTALVEMNDDQSEGNDSNRNQSEMTSSESTNQSQLDDYQDTATEYYKNFNIEEFLKRETNLAEHGQILCDELPSLMHDAKIELHYFLYFVPSYQ